MTESEKRKQDMKELWKDTFHDSDLYIDLVFETYFSMENSFVRYRENRLIAAMLCVPYEFRILTKGGDKETLRGMYLCGLATHPEWRRRGIMADLMNEAEENLRARGYDLTFLIPADDHLREYYLRKGYRNSSWRSNQRIETADIKSEDSVETMHVYSIKEFLQNGKGEFVEQLAEWCREIEESRQFNTIVHSRKDFLTIMAENENSIFLSNSTFDPENPILANETAVAFPDLSDAPEEPLRIVGLYYKDSAYRDGRRHTQDDMTEPRVNVKKDRCQKQACHEETQKPNKRQTSTEDQLASKILKPILTAFNQKGMELILPCGRQERKEGSTEMYAMIKILHQAASETKYDNLEFEISLMLD